MSTLEAVDAAFSCLRVSSRAAPLSKLACSGILKAGQAWTKCHNVFSLSLYYGTFVFAPQAQEQLLVNSLTSPSRPFAKLVPFVFVSKVFLYRLAKDCNSASLDDVHGTTSCSSGWANKVSSAQ